MTKPYSFSIFIANCRISGKYKDGDYSTHFQMNRVIPCHMLTQTTLSQRRSFFLKRNLQQRMMKRQTTTFPLLWYQVSLSWRVWACWSKSQKSPLMKENTTTDDLGDLLWLVISKKAQRSHHQRNLITKIIAWRFKVYVEWNINTTSYKDLRHKDLNKVKIIRSYPAQEISSSMELKIFKIKFKEGDLC